MMHFLYTIFIAMVNNLDNVGVIIAYSFRGIKISLQKNLWISFITLIISTLAAFSGKIITIFLNKSVCSIISMILLIAMGLWIILEPFIKKDNKEDTPVEKKENNIYGILKDPSNADADNSKDIDFKEATMLGIALSINNIGCGLSAGMIALNPLLIGLFSAIFNFLALWAGGFITNLLSRWKLDKKATIFSGILLIIIGIKQIL